MPVHIVMWGHIILASLLILTGFYGLYDACSFAVDIMKVYHTHVLSWHAGYTVLHDSLFSYLLFCYGLVAIPSGCMGLTPFFIQRR